MGAVALKADYSFKDQNTYLWRYIERLNSVRVVLNAPDLGFDKKMNKLQKLFDVPHNPPPPLDEEGVLD
jgi:hypothetical protein